jgi:hypothetical protein
MPHLENSYFNRAIYKGILFELTINNELLTENSYYLKWNFKEDKFAKCYYLPITPSELDSAYSIENYCEYRGEVLECSFNGEKNEFGFDMRWVSKEICEKFGLAYEYERKVISRGIEDTGLVMRVPDSEIQDVWEIHKPIEGFPFKGPEKVWVKKDGVWLR